MKFYKIHQSRDNNIDEYYEVLRIIKLRSQHGDSQRVTEEGRSSYPTRGRGLGSKPRQVELKKAQTNASSFLPLIEEINIIIGDPYIGGNMMSKQRIYAGAARNPVEEVFQIRDNSKLASLSITFDSHNEHGVIYPHCSALRYRLQQLIIGLAACQ